MTSRPPRFPVYDVRGDPARLKKEGLGPLFARVSVGLTPVDFDANWERSFLAISRESERFARFTLDKDNSSVFFTCRANESQTEIQNLIGRLHLLLELTNLRATMVAASSQSDTA